MSAGKHLGRDDNVRETPNQDVSAGHSAVPTPLRQLADLIATSPHNLVARNEREDILARHVLEAEALAAILQPDGAWMDLGTGGGLPGLVLAWRHPQVQWTLVDATRKKVEEVARFARALALDNVVVVTGRAEALAHQPALRGQFAGVVSRAVAPMSTLVELCRGFLAPDGALVAVKGPSVREELRAAQGAMRTLLLEHESTERLAGGVRESWVVRMRALGPPPAGYPRRDGVPKQDPLR